MRILLINVPHPAIGSRIPDDHLPPLGLLSIGGPLIDDGHDVGLIDAEFGPMPVEAIVAEASRFAPDAVLFGHSGSTSGHPVIAEVAQAIVKAVPGVGSSMAACFRPITGATSCARSATSPRSCAARAKRLHGV
ncbi:radical SAM superfamily enzyme YgiQ (UPF0313 family) [Bradyrhizobium elkanii]|nr:radical SAM superfamily enzyme YgiQ (UPF0313 family) [Bradyrhizobium elkanii]